MQTLVKPESIVDIPEFYNSSLQAVSNVFAPKILELSNWRQGYKAVDTPLEIYLKEKQEEARSVLSERAQSIFSIMRDVFPTVLKASDLPTQDKDLLLSIGKSLKSSTTPSNVELAVDTINNDATSPRSRKALRAAVDVAIVTIAKKSDNRAKLQRSIRLATTHSSSDESLVAIRQVIDNKIFGELSSEFAWIDLQTSQKLTQNMQYSNKIGRKIMRLAHEHNVLKGALRYSTTPKHDIETYITSKISRKLMLKALADKEQEISI